MAYVALSATGLPSARTSPREVAEMALAHAIPSAVEAAYRRGDLFEKRRTLMDAWAAYCAKVDTDAGKVVAIRALMPAILVTTALALSGSAGAQAGAPLFFADQGASVLGVYHLAHLST